MNEEKISAGHEINRLIGMRVMGLPDKPYGQGMKCPDCGGEVDFRIRAWCYNCQTWFYGSYSDYSGLIEFTWKIVEKLHTEGYGITIDFTAWNSPYVKIRNTANTLADAVAQTVPLAICRAALALKAIEESR